MSVLYCKDGYRFKCPLLNYTSRPCSISFYCVKINNIMPTKFTENVIHIISNIPEGKVLTYGTIAALAGSPRASRQVTRILHSSSKKYNLPWHRVVNSKGQISIKIHDGYNEQKARLESEGVIFSGDDRIDFKKYLWQIKSINEIN